MAIVIVIEWWNCINTKFIRKWRSNGVCRTAMCSSRVMCFTGTVCGWSWRENDIFPFIYLFDFAKVNFSVIILNSGFRFLDSGFRIPDSGLGLPFQSSLVCSGEVILLIQTLTIASEFAIIVTGVPCALTFKKWFIFQGLLCSERLGMFFIFVTWFVVRNFVFVQRRVFRPSPLPLDTRFRSGSTCHIYGRSGHKQNRLFCRPGGDISILFAWFQFSDCCCVTFSHVIWQTERVPSWGPPSRFEFLSLFSLHRPRLQPGHFIFYCSGPGFSEFHGLSSV